MKLEKQKDGSLLVTPSGFHQGEETELLGFFLEYYEASRGVLVEGHFDDKKMTFELQLVVGPHDALTTRAQKRLKDAGVKKQGWLARGGA